ncbi:MAG: hypothetical protein QM570_18160 [Planctomycetota bacterium]|nr:hypothetical protein [Planctomycetota bacterium]
MPRMTGRVLKAGQVQWQGAFQLELHPKAGAGSETPSEAAVPAKIRIVENQSQFALFEVTCACGKTLFVRCEYSEPQESPMSAQAALS